MINAAVLGACKINCNLLIWYWLINTKMCIKTLRRMDQRPLLPKVLPSNFWVHLKLFLLLWVLNSGMNYHHLIPSCCGSVWSIHSNTEALALWVFFLPGAILLSLFKGKVQISCIFGAVLSQENANVLPPSLQGGCSVLCMLQDTLFFP